MNLTVSYLLGRFPVRSEWPILAEIAACKRLGAQTHLIAFNAAEEALPAEFAGLSECVQYLDIARERGLVVSGVAGLRVGIGYAFQSPCLACSLFADPAGRRAAMFCRRGRLAKLLTQQRPDLVHAQFGHLGFSFLPVIASDELPLIVSFRGQDVLLVDKARRQARAHLFEYAARFLVRSRDMQKDLVQMGCPAEKVVVHPSGIDVEKIPFKKRAAPYAEDQLIILMAGRLVEKKGMADALHAVAECRPDPRGPRIHIAGDGPEEEGLRKLARDLGITERVTFLGPLSRTDLLKEMLSAHLFLLTCHTAADGEKEGLPNTIKEAQATGLPVISTRHAGIPECVADGDSGLLAREGDVADIARQLDTLLAHPEKWAEMGQRGRAIIAEQYDLKKLALELVAVYRETVAAALAKGKAG